MVNEQGRRARPAFTRKEAAERCGVSVSTIRRRLDNQGFPNAFRGAHGEWRIPVEDLIAAGFVLNRPDGEHAHRAGSTEMNRGHEHPDEQELSNLRAWYESQVAVAEHRAAIAEARLEERERTLAVYTQANEDLRTSLRMLNPGPPEPPVFRYEPDEPATPDRRNRRKWWQLRGKGR